MHKKERFQSTQLHTNDLELLQPAKKKQNCTVADETHEMKMANVIQSFHDSINCGPEYICTCCDQLWYRSSVTKCDASKYTKCTKNLLDACITGKTSVNKTRSVTSETLLPLDCCVTAFLGSETYTTLAQTVILSSLEALSFKRSLRGVTG